MEIFQTIWTALTTPNEILTNLLSIPLAFLDAYVCVYFFIFFAILESGIK